MLSARTLKAQQAVIAKRRLDATIGRVRWLMGKRQKSGRLGMEPKSDQFGAFVRAANRYLPSYQDYFSGNLTMSTHIYCSGQYNGSMCVSGDEGTVVGTPFNKPTEMGGILQMDHVREMEEIIDTWTALRGRMQPPPAAWDDGVDADRLLHLILSVAFDPNPRLAAQGAPWVTPRCRGCHKPMPHHRPKLEFRLCYISLLAENLG